MITQAVGEVVDLDRRGIEVVISVPDGERMARKTTNARLGILGGISILGTTGIVRPFSTASWRASVEQAISVLAAQGEDTVVLCTGGRTEKGAMALLPRPARGLLRRGGRLHRRRAAPGGRAPPGPGRLRRHGRQAHQAGQRGPDDPLHALQGRPRPAQRDHAGRGRPPPTSPHESPPANTARHAAELWEQAGLLPAAGRELCARAARVLSRFAADGGRRGNHAPARSASSWSTSPARPRSPRRRRERGMNSGVNSGLTVTVIGCDGRPPGPGATQALAEARTVIGAPRHLDAVPIPDRAERIGAQAPRPGPRRPRPKPGPVVVLASGDPGFFGIVRALRARGIEPAVIPAVSSVALAFARLGLDWDDALVVSAHGRDPAKALAAALAHPKTAILTAPGAAADLGAELLRRGQDGIRRRVPRRSRRRGVIAISPPTTDLADPNVLISLDEDAPGEPRWLAGHQGAPDGWALPEDAFAHRDSMITKAEVRALVLARLGPAPGRVIWDVGAGSGSVAVECARFGAHVIAIEADPAQCERIQHNAATHGVRVQVRNGRAPGALEDLPPANAVFAGGGDHAVLEAAIRPPARDRIVVTLAAVSRVAETAALLTAHGYQPGGVQLQASRLGSLPNGQLRLAAENPVFVLWGNR